MHWDHPDFYRKSRDEMMALSGELEDAVNRPGEIAQRCNVKLKGRRPLPPLRHSSQSHHRFLLRLCRDFLRFVAVPSPARQPRRSRYRPGLKETLI
jgi:DNA polymerase III alpha subunit